MLHDLKTTLNRSAPTLAQDLAGVAALVIMLAAGLHLPLLF